MDGKRHQFDTVFLQQIGEAIERGGAGFDGGARPSFECGVGGGDGGVHLRDGRIGGRGADVGACGDGGCGVFEGHGVLQIKAFAVAAHGTEQVGGEGDGGVARALHRRDLLDRIGEQFFLGDVRVGELMHEAGVGAVFEQAAHEIGEEVAVAANGRVDTAVVAAFAHQPIMKAFAHAVQALKFEVAAVARPFEQGRDGEGVVAGKRSVDVLRSEHVARAGEVGDVGRGLAREERIVGEPGLLRALDLAVPVRALHEAHGDLAVRLAADRVRPGDDRAATLRIGLHGHAELVPAGKRRRAGSGGDDVERHDEPLRFLGVDGEADVRLGGAFCEFDEHGGEFGNAGVGVRGFIARVERGELYRNAVVAALAALADGVDRIRVGAEVALCVGPRARRLAEHVEAGDEAGVILVVRAFQRLLDRAAHHEHLPHQAHRGADGSADHRLADAADQALQRRSALADERAGDDEAPCRAVDERGIGFARVRRPVGGAELVANEEVGGFGIRHAQERFGEREEGDALVGVEAVFLKEAVDPAARLRGAEFVEEARGARGDPAPCRCIDARSLAQRQDHVGLGRAVQALHIGKDVGDGHDGSFADDPSIMPANAENVLCNFGDMSELYPMNSHFTEEGSY